MSDRDLHLVSIGRVISHTYSEYENVIPLWGEKQQACICLNVQLEISI